MLTDNQVNVYDLAAKSFHEKNRKTFRFGNDLNKFHEKIVESSDENNQQNFLRFQLDALCSIYEQIPAKVNGKLLDFGSGANLHAVATAADKFDEIHMTVVCEKNREELLKWIENKPGCIDWTPTLDYITGRKNASDAKHLAAEIRTKVQAIWKHDEILENGYDFVKFDTVICNLGLEFGFPTIHDHSEATRKLTNLLKPHGYFVMIGILEDSENIEDPEYKSDGVQVSCSPIRKEQVKYVLHSAGLEICDWKEFEMSENRTTKTFCNDYGRAFALLARKT